MRNGTPGFRPERLRAAREARSMSGASLAELAGVTRAAISQYERGEQTPSPMVLQRIADAVNLPQQHFLASIHSVESPVFYRSFASALKRSRLRAERRLEWLQEIVNYLSASIEFPAINLPDFSTSNVLGLNGDEIEDIATKVRRHWGLGDGPIPHMVRLAENNGVITARQFLDSDHLDAFSYWPDQGKHPLVVLSSDKECAVRSRYDLAHEIGHLVLHRHIRASQLTSKSDFKKLELQANRFAGAFLLPAKTFLEELYSLTLDAFLAQKSRWLVSVALMVRRCEDLGVLNEDLAHRLWINLGRRGWRRREPLDDDLLIEQPLFLTRCFELLVSTGPTAKDVLLSKLPWTATEIEELVGLPERLLQPHENDPPAIEPRIIRFPGVG